MTTPASEQITSTFFWYGTVNGSSTSSDLFVKEYAILWECSSVRSAGSSADSQRSHLDEPEAVHRAVLLQECEQDQIPKATLKPGAAHDIFDTFKALPSRVAIFDRHLQQPRESQAGVAEHDRVTVLTRTTSWSSGVRQACSALRISSHSHG